MIIGGKRERRLPSPCPADSGGGAMANTRSSIISSLLTDIKMWSFQKLSYLRDIEVRTKSVWYFTGKQLVIKKLPPIDQIQI